MKPVAAVLAATGWLVLVPAALDAQVVRGRVVGAGAGQPARGAIVSLLTPDGRRVAPALVGEDGAYVVTAPAPGAYRVRVDLIGYRSWQSDSLALRLTDTLTVDVRLPLRRVELATVRVEGESRCAAQPQQVPRTVALWEEIRRALTISDLSTRDGLVPLDLTVTEERRTRTVAARPGSGRRRGFYRGLELASSADLQAQDRVVSREQRRTRAAGVRPWAERSPADVAAHGFVRAVSGAYEYVGPDVPILLSSEFLATHCFRPVRRDRLLGEDAIGLAFEPVPGRTLPEVTGTIWLDAATSELRTVEFSFVNLPAAVQELGDAGGRLDFARQPSGAWYVQHWEIERHGLLDARGGSFVHRTTGEAVPVGAPRVARAPAVLRGVVIDSTVREGLAGAVVHVPGVPPVRTDSLGRFAVMVPGLPAESLDVVVRVEHPRLALLGLAGAEQTVRLRAGASTGLVLATPSVPTLLGALCPMDGQSARDEGGALRLGMLVGRATGADGGPLPDGARLVAEWPSDEGRGEGVAARTQQRALPIPQDGRFRLCPLPVGRPLRLHVEADGVAGPVTELVLSAFGIGRIELTGAP
ncbi:MAG TPA: carboxypeptidase-like regulatory domain-containing protein [Gemmatimonadaceae bacterium]|nr:carboxypeptidase-like regulatory domain-containing protein [Gemmatimonadaceae bacterium]